MSPTPRPWHCLLIVSFCLWHMFSVAAYLLPASGDNAFNAVRQLSVPYVLALSQWQKWDIFSPNPLRRNSVYYIERNAGDRYETAMVIDFSHLSWHERAKELKVLGRLQDSWKALLPNYLLSLCPRIPSGPGTDVRLLVRNTVLPSDLASLKRVAKTTRIPEQSLLASVRCPRF